MFSSKRAMRGLAMAFVAAVMVTAGVGTAWAASERTAKSGRTEASAYLQELVRAEAVCLDRASLPVSGAEMTKCVGDLAAPDPRSPAQMDIFRMFSNCLYIAEQQALDQAAPPTTEDYEKYVNECLGL